MDQLRILLVGDYSNYHRTLATGLRRLGCEVSVMSSGSGFMQNERDIDISRRSGKLGGASLFGRLLFPLHKEMKGFDIVSLRDPDFLELKSVKCRFFLNRLIRENRSVFMSGITNDVFFLDMLSRKDCPLAYSEWFVKGEPTRLYYANECREWEAWHDPRKIEHTRYVYEHIDGAVSGLYEYHLSMQECLPAGHLAYGGIPIDLDAIPFANIGSPDRVRLFLGRDRNRMMVKGSDLLEEAARNVLARHPGKGELIIVENVPHREFKERMASCHAVLDQIYSYTPATMALEAMAMGLTAVSGGEEDYYRFIGEKRDFPIVNAPIALEPLEKVIENIILNPSVLEERGRMGREFVKRHNSTENVAKRNLEFWQRRLCEKEDCKIR